MTESANDPGRRASRADNRRRPRAAPSSRGVPPARETSAGVGRGSRAPVYQILWVEAAETRPFPGADSILSKRCGAISGRLRFASSPLAPTETRRFKRLLSGLRVGILFPFGNFQSFAGQKISNPAATRSPLPCAPRRAIASPHAGERAPSYRAGRRDLNAVVVVHASAPRPTRGDLLQQKSALSP